MQVLPLMRHGMVRRPVQCPLRMKSIAISALFGMVPKALFGMVPKEG